MRLPFVSRKRYEAVKVERDQLHEKLAEAIRWHREVSRAHADRRFAEIVEDLKARPGANPGQIDQLRDDTLRSVRQARDRTE